jgi:formamidase
MEAARTIPGRENGVNCDIKNLSRGSKIYLPVFVDGANFSTGDMHFSQGDGEISFCGAIEMSGFLELKYIPYLLNICISMFRNTILNTFDGN